MSDTATMLMKGDRVYHSVDNAFWVFSAVLSPEETALSGRNYDETYPWVLIFPNDACMRSGEHGLITSMRHVYEEGHPAIAITQEERAAMEQNVESWSSAEIINAYMLGVVNMSKSPDEILAEIKRINALEKGRGILAFLRGLRQNRSHIINQVSNEVENG